ncbi:AAA family ATPase [Corallococcus carmarthensis]|uniref:AAA family ATPase n=1 Tax=Corallococcus carmarthensis TaxID=2316728 RepID=UPI00148BE4C7|nr:ATP-binding protein [Corallococcus carmarthensis]NOK17531.1 AAA family ATPase [Corallococcus carmarthensis]
MLKEIKLTNWKSFGETSLFIDPLTVVIGLNASGKSNALDALEFLRRTALGLDFSAALGGDIRFPPLRGGVEWATRIGQEAFTLECLIGDSDIKADYRYSITIEMTGLRPELSTEVLTAQFQDPTNDDYPSLVLFRTADFGSNKSSLALIHTVVDEEHAETNEDFMEEPDLSGFAIQSVRRSSSLLSQLALGNTGSKSAAKGIQSVFDTLRNIFILDPSPSRMRSYVPLSDTLLSDGSNTAGVLAALDSRERSQVEKSFKEYLSRFAERDILKVWAEAIGKFKQDAMLYCREQWVPDQQPTEVDARGMSDGTLRFVAILTALMTRPRGSLLVIEEVDNGLHPSRARLLLEMLKRVATDRGIDVLVTTHNVALLDTLGPDLLPFVQAAHRDPKTGGTLLTPIQDLSNLPKLLAVAPLGRLASQGLLEQSLSRDAEEPTS